MERETREQVAGHVRAREGEGQGEGGTGTGTGTGRLCVMCYLNVYEKERSVIFKK